MSEEIIDALRAESPVGLKLYLEYLIFERNDTVLPLSLVRG